MTVMTGKRRAPFGVIKSNNIMMMLLLLELFKNVLHICTLLNTTESIPEAFRILIGWSLKFTWS